MLEAKDFQILVVDDVPEERELLSMILEDNFAVRMVDSANQALGLIAEGYRPDLVVLDINMPDIDGYELCQTIKNDPELTSIEVMFVSSRGSTDAIIKGFEVGAIEFITKPFDVEYLHAKIFRIIEHLERQKQLSSQAKNANELVYTMMGESGNLATIVNFFRNTFHCKNAVELLDATLETLRQLDLNAVVYFSTNNISESGATNGLPSMLELELAERLIGYPQPFLEQNRRLFIVQKNIVVLIKNSPEDGNVLGALRDSVMTLLEGANAKLAFLDSLSEKSHQKMTHIGEVINVAKQALDEICNRQQAHKLLSIKILENMLSTMEDAFLSKGLTEQQEQELIDIMAMAIDESVTHVQSGTALDEEVRELVIELSSVAKEAAA